jgi:hypothetical protein
MTTATSAKHIESIIFARLKAKHPTLARVVITPSAETWSVSVAAEPGQQLHRRCSADAIEVSQELKGEYHLRSEG